jgi:hypothetical protein
MSVEILPAPSPPKKKRRRRIAYLRSGMYSRRPELPAADTPVGAILAERRAGLEADLGGDLSTAQAALVDLAIRQWCLLDAVDAYLLSLPSIVDRRHRRVWPVVLDRSRLAAQLEATLARLGLQRVPKPVPTLTEYLAEKAEP